MNWLYCVRRETTVFPAHGVTASFGTISNVLEIPFDYSQVRFVLSEWWYPADEYTALKALLAKKVDHDIEYFFRIGEKQRQMGEALKQYVRGATDLAEYAGRMKEFYSFWWIAVPAAEILEEKVRALLVTHDQLAIPFEDLVFTTRELELVRQKRLLFQSAVDMTAHAQQFAWISSSYHLGTPLTSDDFVQMRGEQDGEAVLERMRLEEERKESVLSLLEQTLLPEEMALVRAMQEIIFLRNYQKETVNECQYLSEPFLKSVAKSLGMDWDRFLKHSPDELLNGVDIGQRNEWAIILDDGDCFVTENVEQFALPEQTVDRPSGGSVVGSPASPGVAQGTVRVVLHKDDLNNFVPGEVLVTTMTSIDYVHAMRHAAAVVTDEGGITCHAAIFSREVGVPCVIGTRNATAVFRTGDVVEVNADSGRVRRVV